ncbi:MAG: hypothetical protein R3358_04890 [Woeseiaceae bacterium]|nr:hypothetical protein [Woeseiaceae bacterium]
MPTTPARISLALALMTAAAIVPLHAMTTTERPALNVSIAVFDPGVPDDPSLHRELLIFPRIRHIEASLLPFALRNALSATRQWGAVRVVPRIDPAAELLIGGRINQSDGNTLELQITATDASGDIWIDRPYAGTSLETIFESVARDLGKHLQQLSDKQTTDIIRISLLRYAEQVAPSAFAGYLQEEGGRYSILRLPALDDPMVERIERVRGTDYAITDIVDERFEELHEEIASVYELWREYRGKLDVYQQQDLDRVSRRGAVGDDGSYEAILRIYENYKWDRIAVQEQDKLARAFDNEVGPVIDEMEYRVGRLEGLIEQKYAEWQRILEELFEVETGFGDLPAD